MGRGVWLAPGIDAETGALWRAEFPGWFAAQGDPQAALDPTRFARRESELGPLFAKRDAARSRRSVGVWCAWRKARGLRAFHLGRAMHALELPTPEPLAYVLRRGWPPFSDGVLITRYVEGQDPWSFLEAAPDRPRALGELIEALADSIESLHSAGFRHMDLKAPNLLVQRHASTSKLKITFIDLESARAHRHVGRGRVVRDLARVCASFFSPRAEALGLGEPEWERFLGAYLKRSVLDDSILPLLLGATRRWAQRHNADNRDQGRPIT